MRSRLAMPAAAVALATASAAALPSSATVPVGEIVDPVVCRSAQEQTYALYLPTAVDGAAAADRFPVLFVLDPRGRGRMAAELFREPAERHGWIVLSSNTSRSDTTEDHNGPALAALLGEVVDDRRWPGDPRRLYVAGMSGTARFAWLAARALEGGVAGIVSVAGGLPERHEEWLESVRFGFFGAAGTLDFNYEELAELDEQLDGRGVRHHVEFFDGRHGWAPPEVLARAVGWLELEAMRSGRRPVDRELAGALWERSLAAARERGQRDPWSRLHALEQIVTDYEGLVELEDVAAEVARLQGDPAVAAARRAHADALTAERAWEAELNRVLRELLEVERRAPPVPELAARLRIEALRRQAGRDGVEGASAGRMLETAYVQLSFYLPRELRRRGEAHAAITPLELATRVFPERPVAWYDLACARAQAGRERSALGAFETAVDRGFAWPELADRDPDLDPIRDRERFVAALARLHAAATTAPAGGP
jgi:dienelactone hydrolase